MTTNMAVIAKDLFIMLWWVFLSAGLIWLISHLLMATIKTLFCDVQIKIYKTWCKRLKHYINDGELEKVLDEMKNQKKI